MDSEAVTFLISAFYALYARISVVFEATKLLTILICTLLLVVCIFETRCTIFQFASRRIEYLNMIDIIDWY